MQCFTNPDLTSVFTWLEMRQQQCQQKELLALCLSTGRLFVLRGKNRTVWSLKVDSPKYKWLPLSCLSSEEVSLFHFIVAHYRRFLPPGCLSERRAPESSVRGGGRQLPFAGLSDSGHDQRLAPYRLVTGGIPSLKSSPPQWTTTQALSQRWLLYV